MNRRIFLVIYFLLCSLWGFTLFAQSESDLEVKVTPFPASCEQNGSIHIDVRVKNGQYQIGNITCKCTDSSGKSLTGQDGTSSSTITGLSQGIYKLEIKILFTNSHELTINRNNINIFSSYQRPSLAALEDRPTLKGYPKPTGIISVMASKGSAQKYTAKIISCPSNYTGYKSFEFAPNKMFYFYELPAGEYQVQISDDCYSYPAMKVTVNTTEEPYYQKNISRWINPLYSNCGWFDMDNFPNLSNFKYFSPIDTLLTYYDVAFASENQLKSGINNLKWYNSTNIPPSPATSEDVALYRKKNTLAFRVYPSRIAIAKGLSKDRPRFVCRIRGSQGNESYKSYELICSNKSEWCSFTSSYPKGRCDEYKIGVYLKTTFEYLYCPPIKVEVYNIKEPNKILETKTLSIDNSSKENCVWFDMLFQPNENYGFRYSDTNNDQSKFENSKQTFDVSISPDNDDLCQGKKFGEIFIYVYQANDISRTSLNISGYKIILRDAPTEYTLANAKMKIGEVVTVPDGSSYTSYHISSSPEYLPPGNYVFEVITPCGQSLGLETLSIPVVPKISLGTKPFKPKVSMVRCGFLRIYPFPDGSNNVMLMGGKRYDNPYVVISKRPSNITESNIITFDGSSLGYNKCYFRPTSSDKTKDCYFEIPLTTGSVELLLTDWYSHLYDCSPRATLDLSTANISYDRDTYIGYRCPSGTYGYISFQPINYVGHLDVELRKISDNTVVWKKEDIAIKHGDRIDIEIHKDDPSKDPIEESYLLYLKDRECQNDNKKGTPISLYDLNSASVVRTKRKYCEGEEIKLECVTLGGKGEYEWIFPDGTHHNGRVVTIPHAENQKHSGSYTLIVRNVICDNAPTTSTIHFALSVSPPVLWWSSKAQSADWSDLNNWETESGNAAKAIPASCTSVHIPSEVTTYYPDLNPDVTKEDKYAIDWGTPECDNIYFHYGSKLGSPQLLNYNKAFVDYNFATDNQGALIPNGGESSLRDKRYMQRDRWYMVSTPLKNIVSGDFELSGHPFSYQRFLKVAQNELTEASFSTPTASLGSKFGDYQNALALKIAGYNPGRIGYKDQDYLNGLNGIIRLPFYMDNSISKYRPYHRYSEGSSTFYYYNKSTLQPLNIYETVKRSAEDFRFVFEGDIPKEKIKPIERVTSFRVNLTNQGGASFIMVGNPFMTGIDFDKLYEANKDRIEPYYYVFENSWLQYHKQIPASSLGQVIDPLRAFVVKTKGGATFLEFPISGQNNVLASPNPKIGLQKNQSKENTPIISVRAHSKNGEGSPAILLPTEDIESSECLIYPGLDQLPTVYFVDSQGKFNSVQSSTMHTSVLMGVHSSMDGLVDLQIQTNAKSYFRECYLRDLKTNKLYDLLTQDHLSFYLGVQDGTRFELLYSLTSQTGLESCEKSSNIRIERRLNGFEVVSDNKLLGWSLYSFDGQLLYANQSEMNVSEFFINDNLCKQPTILVVLDDKGIQRTYKLPACN